MAVRIRKVSPDGEYEYLECSQCATTVVFSDVLCPLCKSKWSPSEPVDADVYYKEVALALEAVTGSDPVNVEVADGSEHSAPNTVTSDEAMPITPVKSALIVPVGQALEAAEVPTIYSEQLDSDNLVVNPSFEDGLFPWVISGAPGWIDTGRVQEIAYDGLWAWELEEAGTTVANNQRGVRTGNPPGSASWVPAAPGDVHCSRFRCYALDGDGGSLNAEIAYYNSAGSRIAQHVGAVFPTLVKGQWVEAYGLSSAAPAGTVAVDFLFYVRAQGTPGRHYYIDYCEGYLGAVLP